MIMAKKTRYGILKSTNFKVLLRSKMHLFFSLHILKVLTLSNKFAESQGEITTRSIIIIPVYSRSKRPPLFELHNSARRRRTGTRTEVTSSTQQNPNKRG